MRHNLAPRRLLVVWGAKRFNPPDWLLSRFPVRYVSARLFAWPDETLANRTLNTPLGVAAGSAVSTPELAVLELLYDVGTHEDIEEARNLFEGIRNLRVDLVGCLLGCCTSVKQSDCS